MFLYVISDGTAIKIGISKHPDKRVKQLQTGHPNRLSIAFKLETQKAREIESHLHKILWEKRSRSAKEWFKMDCEDWLKTYIISLNESL